MNRATVEVERRDIQDETPLARITDDPRSFLDRTWGRRASVHPGADARRFSDLLTLDDVDRILSTTSLRTPGFRLVRAGERIPESAYTRSGRTGSQPVEGMVDPTRVFELFRQGATIVLQGLHRYRESVARFTRDLELELGHHCQVNAYITPAGAQGLALHEDPHDVFVLQAFGQKRWEVHSAPAGDAREPIRTEVAPGDCIYMPAGTPHSASTQATLSGHLTVGVHVAPWRDVAADVWKRIELDAGLDEPVPAGWTRDPERFANLVRERLAAMRTAIDKIDPDEIADARVERFLSSRAQLMRGALVDQTRLDDVDDETALVRRLGSVCELRVRDGRLIALLGDRRLEMPDWLEPAMRRVAAATTLTPGDLRVEVPDPRSRLVLVRRLVREGLLLLGSAR